VRPRRARPPLLRDVSRETSPTGPRLSTPGSARTSAPDGAPLRPSPMREPTLAQTRTRTSWLELESVRRICSAPADARAHRADISAEANSIGGGVSRETSHRIAACTSSREQHDCTGVTACSLPRTHRERVRLPLPPPWLRPYPRSLPWQELDPGGYREPSPRSQVDDLPPPTRMHRSPSPPASHPSDSGRYLTATGVFHVKHRRPSV